MMVDEAHIFHMTGPTHSPVAPLTEEELLRLELEEKMKGFNPRLDILAVPEKALPLVGDGVKAIGLPSLRNVAKVSVGGYR